MDSHLVDLVYKTLTSILALSLGSPVKTTERCHCCGRSPEVFGFMAYAGTDGYRRSYLHCRSCQTFFASDTHVMGVENPKKPNTSQRFGMWSGVGAVIDVNKQSAVLFAPEGVVKKLPNYFKENVNIITATTGQHIPILADMDVEYPILYIQDFGRKTYDLIRGLRLSPSPNEIFMCSDTQSKSSTRVNFTLNITTALKLKGMMTMLSNKEVNFFYKMIASICRGDITPIESTVAFQKNDIFGELLNMMPVDPHARKSLLSILKKL